MLPAVIVKSDQSMHVQDYIKLMASKLPMCQYVGTTKVVDHVKEMNVRFSTEFNPSDPLKPIKEYLEEIHKKVSS